MDIEYAEDWLASMGGWGDLCFVPNAIHTRKSNHNRYLFSNSRRLRENLHILGRKDRPEWQNNLAIISNSIAPYSYNHINRVKIHKVSMIKNYLVLHVGICLVDDTQFQCGYVLSDSLNLCGNFYSQQFEGDDFTDEENNSASRDKTSLDLSSISFELPRKTGQVDADIEEILDDLESESEEPSSVSSHDEHDAPSDRLEKAENELAEIFSNSNNENPERTNKSRRTLNWQPDIFRPLTRSPLLPDLKSANTRLELFQSPSHSL